MSEIVRAFKSFSARRINELRGTPGVPVWRRDYWGHVIRDEISLQQLREYVANNPLRWEEDRRNPEYAAASNRPRAG